MNDGPYKLPAGWRWVKLGEVAKVCYGRANPKRPGNIPVVGSGGIYDYTETALVSFPTVVIGRKGSAGETILVKEPSWPSDTTFYLEWLCEVLSDWIAAWLMFRKPSSEGTTATLPTVRREDLELYPIPLPPLDEQRRIVARIEELMARIREARRLREQAREDAERLWQSVLADTFPRPGSDLPPGWRWVRLGEVCGILSGGTPSKKIPEYWKGQIPWVSPKDMYSGPYVTDTQDHLSELGAARTRLVKPRSLLVVVRSGILARKFPVAITARTVAFNQDIKALVPRDRSLEVSYLFHALSAAEPGVLSEGVKKGVTVHSIRSGYLELLCIPLPPLPEQRHIVAHLEAVQERIRAIKEAQAATEAELKRLEQSIPDKAFRGEL